MQNAALDIARRDIVAYFDGQKKLVLARADIERVVVEQRGFWRLSARTKVRDVIAFMLAKTKLRAVELEFPSNRIVRYAWGDISPLEIALTIKPNAYFTHYTAMYLHGLTEQIPRTVYVNCEQPPKKRQKVEISQRSIDVAFGRAPRVSQNVSLYGDQRLCILSGMHTGGLGVVSLLGAGGEALRATDKERTLIDIAVRPFYSGGIHEVLTAYKLAKGSVSVNTLVARLKTLAFVYPYHQAIGFYLERAGYKPSVLRIVRSLPMEFDFYLTYEMGKDLSYSTDWRLFFPKGF